MIKQGRNSCFHLAPCKFASPFSLNLFEFEKKGFLNLLNFSIQFKNEFDLKYLNVTNQQEKKSVSGYKLNALLKNSALRLLLKLYRLNYIRNHRLSLYFL